MSAQRNQRPSNPGHRRSGDNNPGQDERAQKISQQAPRRPASGGEWASSQGEDGPAPANRIGSPSGDRQGTNRGNTMPPGNDHDGSPGNLRQDPERPERPADGGHAEMRGDSIRPDGQSGEPKLPDHPESGDRGRRPARRRLES